MFDIEKVVMEFKTQDILKNFHIIGVSYLQTPVDIRELFSVSNDEQIAFLKDAQSLGLENVVILSTCNRTEVYTQTDNIDLVKRLLVKYSNGPMKLFEEFGYHIVGDEAVNHLYRVGAGLDSQILGDFQIIGQLKNAYRLSEKMKMVNTMLNRIFAHVFQASKKIKNQTELSHGAASVSHAAVQYIKENVVDLDQVNFLLYGTGEIGKTTCDNLVRHMNKKTLTLVNRSEDKAASLAEKYSISYKSEKELPQEIAKADVIIVATGAQNPTVAKEFFKGNTERKLILDLSVPRNVATNVSKLPNIKLVDIDELSQVNNEVLELRIKNVPLAEDIIKQNSEELHEWIEMQHLSPIFKGVQMGLNKMKEQELAYHRTNLTDEEFEKVDLIASNIVNRIARMSISHIKDVFKTEKRSREVLSKMFGDYAKQSAGIHPHSLKKEHKNRHHEN